MRKCLLILILAPIFLSAQTARKINPAAQQLNTKAGKLVPLTSSLDLAGQKRILMILDSAIRLEPQYSNAYFNRIKPLINLKRYNDALASITKSIGRFPGDTLTALIQQGAIHELYLSQPKMAKTFYEKAYRFSTGLIKRNGHVDVSYEYAVTLSLSYLEGKDACIKYLNSVAHYYTDAKSKKTFDSLRSLVNSSKYTRQEKQNLFGKVKM